MFLQFTEYPKSAKPPQYLILNGMRYSFTSEPKISFFVLTVDEYYSPPFRQKKVKGTFLTNVVFTPHCDILLGRSMGDYQNSAVI